jgi:hypothetical protein
MYTERKLPASIMRLLHTRRFKVTLKSCGIVLAPSSAELFSTLRRRLYRLLWNTAERVNYFPNKHGLTDLTVESTDYSCKVCEVVITRGATRRSCRTCHFNICSTCAVKGPVIEEVAFALTGATRASLEPCCRLVTPSEDLLIPDFVSCWPKQNFELTSEEQSHAREAKLKAAEETELLQRRIAFLRVVLGYDPVISRKLLTNFPDKPGLAMLLVALRLLRLTTNDIKEQKEVKKSEIQPAPEFAGVTVGSNFLVQRAEVMQSLLKNSRSQYSKAFRAGAFTEAERENKRYALAGQMVTVLSKDPPSGSFRTINVRAADGTECLFTAECFVDPNAAEQETEEVFYTTSAAKAVLMSFLATEAQPRQTPADISPAQTLTLAQPSDLQQCRTDCAGEAGGLQSSHGNTCSTGERGAAGFNGIQEERGHTGFTGIQGAQGDTGFTQPSDLQCRTDCENKTDAPPAQALAAVPPAPASSSVTPPLPSAGTHSQVQVIEKNLRLQGAIFHNYLDRQDGRAQKSASQRKADAPPAQPRPAPVKLLERAQAVSYLLRESLHLLNLANRAMNSPLSFAVMRTENCTMTGRISRSWTKNCVKAKPTNLPSPPKQLICLVSYLIQRQGKKKKESRKESKT